MAEENGQSGSEKEVKEKKNKILGNSHAKETPAQQQAFELYYSMGEKRSLEAVATAVNKSSRTVGEWSRKYKWKDRITQKELEDAAERGSDSNVLIDSKAEYRRIIRALMATFVKDYKAGKVKIKTMADFERIVKLDLLLLGDYTDRVEETSKQNIELTEEDRRAIFAVADSIRAEMSAIQG